MAKITELIDKRDNFELIRDEIAAILVVEIVNQKALAVTAGKDPALWDFKTLIERSNPWELLEDSDGKITGEVPLVNVYFQSASDKPSSSNLINNQQFTGQFIIDCLASKVSTEDGQGVKQFGDELAAIDVQRVIKLCRNILMSNIYTYIFTSIDSATGLPIANKSIVQKRNISEIQMFQPDLNDRPMENVVAARLTMSVDYQEFSPQSAQIELETIESQCTRDTDGFIYFTIDND